MRHRLPLKKEKVSQNERNSSAKTSGTSPSWIPSKRPQACHALEIKSTEIPGPFQHRKNKNRKDLKCRNGCLCDQGLKLKTIQPPKKNRKTTKPANKEHSKDSSDEYVYQK